MFRKKILIAGGSGLLGVNWAIAMRRQYDVTLLMHTKLIHVEGVNAIKGTVHSVDDALSLIKELMPDIVVNAAGYTSVELCEANPLVAAQVNTLLPAYLASACHQLKIKFVHISTDHLFEGNIPLLDENAQVRPVNVYATTKADAERQVLNNAPSALIIRTNFFCWGTSYRQSFSDRVIQVMRKSQRLLLFTDVYYTPILADIMIKNVHHLIDKSASGIFNVVGTERISKYDFGVKVAEVFKLDTSLIDQGSIADKNDLVKRPQDMSLSNRKLLRLLGNQVPSIDAQIHMLSEQERSGIVNEISAI